MNATNLGPPVSGLALLMYAPRRGGCRHSNILIVCMYEHQPWATGGDR